MGFKPRRSRDDFSNKADGEKAFRAFVRELDKYAPQVHELGNGASELLVDMAEKKLKCRLPRSYRSFLRRWNGGTLFRGDVMIYRIHRDRKELDASHIEDLIESNLPRHRWPGMPETCIQIARTSYGDQLCLDMTAPIGGDVRVVQWSHEEGGTEHTHHNLAAWLEWEMRMGRGAFDYDGNEL